MKNKLPMLTILTAIWLASTALATPAKAGPDIADPALDTCNVVWTSPSKNAAESMPVGGGDTGCNVWVENGDLLLYFQRSGCFSENGEYLKMGRIRLRLDPNPLAKPAAFRQELVLRDGCIEIQATGADGAPFPVKIRVWVEVERPVIHVKVDAQRPVGLTAAYESWRLQDRLLSNSDARFGCFSLHGYPGDVVKLKDAVDFEKGGVLFMHRNPQQSLLPGLLIRQQGLEAHAKEFPDNIGNRTFGGRMWGEGLAPAGTDDGKYLGTPYRAWKLKSAHPAAEHELLIATHIAQTKTVDAWKEKLSALVAETGQGDAKRFDATRAWWRAFWDRSYIHVLPGNTDPASKPWQAGRNYNLFRYQLGCNAYGEYPTKFNGGNLTYDPVLTGRPGMDPDWRAWGGDVFTAQNQRLLYWPMLKAGDFDAMTPHFELYKAGLPGATAKVRAQFGHAGAQFCEYMSVPGLEMGSGWGWEKGPRTRGPEIPFGDPSANAMGTYGKPVEHGIMANAAISYHWESQVEAAYMMLEAHRFNGTDLKPYMPFIEAALVFFDEHYRARQKMRDGKEVGPDGKLVFFPSTSCESYRGAKNPADLIAGIHACLDALLRLDDATLPPERKAYYRAYKDRMPAIPFGTTKTGEPVVKPAESWMRYQNVECPQFYPLFPFNRYDLDGPEMPAFRNAWKQGGFAKGNVSSWHQDGIFFARMGMTAEAANFNVRKLQDSPRRFPTFWGPGHDWAPDHNWGGSGMIGLQEMLLQTVDDKIRVLPAWPKEWDVDFKLHAPGQTVVECSYRNGKIERLVVTPESRRKDVVLPQ